MSRLLIVTLTLALLFARPAPSPLQAQEKPATEKEKIEALIKHIEDLKGAKFVRNGRDYDAKTAARFLRGKWEANESRIRTAKDFVEKVASISSTTGKPYQIRLENGKEVKSRDYLLAELQKLEKAGGKREP
jgi:hypothetical protein